DRIAITSDRGSYAVMASAVDGNFFDTVGVRVVGGRTFTPSEGRDADSSGLVTIVSYRAWQEYFDGAEDVIGRPIAINGQPATVIGVAPPNFHGTMLMERADVWLPLIMYWRAIHTYSPR